MAILTTISRDFPRLRSRGGCNLRALLYSLLLLGAGGTIGPPVLRADEPVASEQVVKAAFLVSFPKYVDWPAGAFANASSPIVIAVAGDGGVIRELQKIIAGRTVNGRQLVLKRLAPGGETSAYHILFIPAEERQRSQNLLAEQKPGILTVGDSDDFLERGGVISMVRRNQKIALDVNLAAAANAGISLSSKLLAVASIVKGRSN
jgi:hypothetical protein